MVLSALTRCLPLVPLVFAACADDGARRPPAGQPAENDGGFAHDAAVDQPARDASAADASRDDGGFVPVDPDDPPYTSGSRIRARTLSSAGKFVAFDGLHDTELDLPCSVRRASDGNFYCLPEVRESFGRFPAYADPGCTQGALLEFNGCAAPDAFHLLTEGACEKRTRVLPVLPSSGDTWYSRDLEGNCLPQPLFEDQRLYTLGEELPLSRFVRAEVGLTAGSGVVRGVWLGADGSRAPRALLMGEDAPCEPGRLLSELDMPTTVHCIPSSRAHQAADFWFADDHCSEPAAYTEALTQTCAQPSLVLKPSLQGPGCQVVERPVELFQVGTPLEVAYEPNIHLQCETVSSELASRFSFFRIGAPLDTSALPILTPALTGAGRLRPYSWHNANGEPLNYVRAEQEPSAPPLLWDDSLRTRCEPLPVGAQVLCAPPRALLVYGDAQCQAPLLEVFEGRDCPLEPPELFSIRGTRTQTCGKPGSHASLSVLRAGAEQAAPATRYIRFQEQCVEASTPAVSARYFLPGENVPNSALAQLDLGVE